MDQRKHDPDWQLESFNFEKHRSGLPTSLNGGSSFTSIQANSSIPSREDVRILSRDFQDALPEPPPNGGLVAWTQVVMGHLLVVNGFGYVTSFGIFQSYYTTTLGRSASDISWVGSFQIFLLFFVGTLSGRAMDAGYFRTLVVAGCTLQLVGVFATSVATQYWQLFLAQGICQGLGNGLLFTPTVSLIAIYFSTRRALALGIAACGAPTGGIIYPLVTIHVFRLKLR